MAPVERHDVVDPLRGKDHARTARTAIGGTQFAQPIGTPPGERHAPAVG